MVEGGQKISWACANNNLMMKNGNNGAPLVCLFVCFFFSRVSFALAAYAYTIELAPHHLNTWNLPLVHVYLEWILHRL